MRLIIDKLSATFYLFLCFFTLFYIQLEMPAPKNIRLLTKSYTGF